MGSFYKEGGYAKDRVFMEHVVLPYHHMYKSLGLEAKSAILRQAFRGHFNIELLFEETLTDINPALVRTADPYMDYTDGSDSKCIGMLIKYEERPDGTRTRVRGNITNVGSKISGIRLAVFNEFEQDIHYFLIPRRDLAVKKDRKLDFQYSITKARYTNGLNDYRIPSLEALAFGKFS